MMSERINLHMAGNTCTVTISEHTWLGMVKIYAPRDQCPVLTGSLNTCAVRLLPGETIHLDAYGDDGEGHYLSTAYLLNEEQDLLKQKGGFAQDVNVDVIDEPLMRYCVHCGQMHYVKDGEFYCPLDPNKA